MRILVSWLRELVAVNATDEELARRLTLAGLEVEAVDRLDRGLEGVVVGEVREREPVPGTHLSYCRVFDGAHERRVVCGAQNFSAGDRVPLAQPGAVLPDGKAIAHAKIRGMESHGMLCSARELGLSSDHAGLLVLPADARPGEPVAPLLGRAGVAFELNVTPNRADALSHVGVARDVAALFGAPLRLPAPKLAPEGGSAPARVEITAADRCPRYAARVLEGVRVGPSPAWLSQRLEALGQRSINNVVDATNFVLFELGHPLHAFDLDRLAGGAIVVRTAGEKEPLTTLDGVARELTADDLVIADLERPVALAGVMGGEDSGVTEKTTRLLLESAYFAPSSVRRTARRHGIHSDASHRFERGVDPDALQLALDRLAEVILEVTGGRLVGAPIDVQAAPIPERKVKLRRARLNQLLGAEVPWEEATGILARLGLERLAVSEAESEWRIPGHRGDLAIEADLVEEVARVRGYEAVTPRPLPGGGTDAAQPEATELLARVRGALSAAGFDEALNFAFAAREDTLRLRPGVEPITLRNPIAADQSVLRTTVLAGLLRNAQHNLRHGVTALRLYETGRAYEPLSEPPKAPGPPGGFRVSHESRRLGLVALGSRAEAGWASDKAGYDFYDLKGAVEHVLAAAGVRAATFELARAPHLHPRASAVVRAADVVLGTAGELHPEIADALELPRATFVAELDLDALVAAGRTVPRYGGVPRFPATLRDLAIVVDEAVEAAKVAEEIRAADPTGLVEEALLFDVYRGAPLPAGRKNLAYSLRYRAPDRTLTDEEVSALHEAIVERLRRAIGAELRA